MGSQEEKRNEVAIVMVPFPAHSHLNLLFNLSHLISSTYGIPVHFAGSASHVGQVKLRHDPNIIITSPNHDIHFHEFETPLPDTTAPSFLHSVLPIIPHLRQPVMELIKQLAAKRRRVIVIHDSFMSSVVQDVKHMIPNAEAYTFHGLSAISLFFFFWRTSGQKLIRLQDYGDNLWISIPSHLPVSKGWNTPVFADFFDKQCNLNSEFESGRLYNTSRKVEGIYMELLEDMTSKQSTNVKHFAIGPLTPVEISSVKEKSSSSKSHRHRCLEWLDKQEKESVVIVSFGTTSFMRKGQIQELATGLEKSKVSFLWLLRSADNNKKAEMEVELEEGFEERTKKQGMIVVREWVPSLIQILAHPSTGGFMNHCGWASCLESISTGVPIVAWPIHGDHPMNSVLVTKVLKVGVAVRDGERLDEFVPWERVQEALRRLMMTEEGKEMRKRAKELGNALKGSLAPGGSSRLEMDSFVAHITR